MGVRRKRCAGSAPAACAGRLLRAAAWAVFVLSAAGFSFSRPASKAPELPRRFELTLREARDEPVYDARTDSAVVRRFESTLAHFGRIEAGGEAHTVFSDSLVFESGTPFRYAAVLRRDTLAVTAMEQGPSTRGAALDADREMLACIFEGPALRIGVSRKDGPAGIENFKAACPGGLYRRLDLPVTLGAFVFPLPSDAGRPGARWQAPAACPSVSGLGASPSLVFTYETAGDPERGGASVKIAIACDTTIANVRVVTPAGDTVDVVSRRIRVRGVLRPWAGLPFFHTGELSIEEDVRYVRPDLESPVLEKRSCVALRLEPR